MRETVNGDPIKKPSYRRILANRNVSSLWISQLVSQSGDYVFNIALLWLVLVTTGSSFYVGLTQALIWIPLVVVSPIAGLFADRFDRRNTMVISNLVQGTITGLISLLYVMAELSLPALLVLVFALFSSAQFLTMALNAVIPRIVDLADLAPTNSLFSMSSSFNKLASYGVGGVIIAVVGAGVAILYDSFSFFFAGAVVLIFFARANRDMSTTRVETQVVRDKGSSFKSDFMAGFHYTRNNRLLLELVLLGIIMNFSIGGMIALISPYSKIWLGGDAITYGLLAGFLGLGALVGSLLFGKLDLRSYSGKVFLGSAFLAGIYIVLLGENTLVFFALPLIFLLGLSNTLAGLSLQVLVQAKVPGELLGRVFAFLVATLNVASPVSAIWAGELAESIRIGTTLTFFGFIIIAASAGLYLASKRLRSAGY